MSGADSPSHVCVICSGTEFKMPVPVATMSPPDETYSAFHVIAGDASDIALDTLVAENASTPSGLIVNRESEEFEKVGAVLSTATDCVTGQRFPAASVEIRTPDQIPSATNAPDVALPSHDCERVVPLPEKDRTGGFGPSRISSNHDSGVGSEMVAEKSVVSLTPSVPGLNGVGAAVNPDTAGQVMSTTTSERVALAMSSWLSLAVITAA